MAPRSRPATLSSFGELLRTWRCHRGKSQLDLALDAGVSPRHLSFVETGRSRPSRAMVLILAAALGVPLRERNGLLLAAGFAPLYRESRLEAPELEPVRQALDLILRHQEPYPAVVMNRHWDLLKTNTAAWELFGFLLGSAAPAVPGPPNLIRMMFDPAAVRPYVSGWEAVAEGLIQRIHREALGAVLDERSSSLLAEALAFPGVPSRWREPDPTVPIAPLLSVAFSKGSFTASFFSTVTVLGTPQDVTLQELRVECFFPADQETAERMERWCELAGAPIDTTPPRKAPRRGG